MPGWHARAQSASTWWTWGWCKSTYSGERTKTQHKVNVIWEIGEKRDDGKPFRPRKRYTLSLHEKASLRKDLESWRGRPFTDSELEGFDLEALLGVPLCSAWSTQPAVSGNVYANVTAIMRPPRGMEAPKADPAYVRVQDQPKDGTPGAQFHRTVIRNGPRPMTMCLFRRTP